MKPVLRWWQYFALHSFVGKSKGILFCRAIQLRDTLSLAPWIVQILRRYGQPFEFSEFPWHMLRNIFLQDRKKIKIKKTAKSLSAFYLYGKPGNSGQKERFISVEISRKKSKTFRKYYLFPVFTETNERFSVLFVCITSARLHIERKWKIYRYFVNGTTQSRSCFWCQKNTSSIWRKFFTKISVQMVTLLLSADVGSFTN